MKKKKNLNKLKELNIYDCEKKGYNVQFFNLFNNQKEAIDFLLSKSQENLEYIKDKLVSLDNAVKSKDIDEVDNCIEFFHNELKTCKNKLIMFEKINNKINEDLLGKFKTFIKIFPYLVELDNNSDNSYNLYIAAKEYFTQATYYISLIDEEYTYLDHNNKTQKLDLKNLEKIKSIKHKINIPNEIEIKIKENKDLIDAEKISKEKTLLLLTYKEVISNIELIEQFIYVFKTKGCSLPIEISINIKYPEVTYILKKQKLKKFSQLSKYLLNVKNYLEKSLDSNYKNHENLRFFHGKQFDTLNKHISDNKEIYSFLRYILNNLNDNIEIKPGIDISVPSTYNYVDNYKDYNNDWFKIYNNYISSVLKENNTSIEELYEKMKIKTEGEEIRGIYLYKSDYNSMEEDILKIFIEKTKNIPIAQNILISNKETSFEEMQAFFHRAFLCRFNTLFAVEINDSLSDIQLKIMNNFISQLLKFQLERYKKHNNISEKIDIKDTSKYIKSLIIFVYNVNKLNESFLNEINKFNPGYIDPIENVYLIERQSTISSKKYNKIHYDNQSASFKAALDRKVEEKLQQVLHKNTHIYSSEICGLGKTEKIKYICKNKDYIYFPLGGKLSRNIIFQKLENILKKVKNVMKTAIHLDLYETEDTSILNEFLFSFCFTKFYSNEKNVLYIPINIEIYIEIPNCFYNFLDNYPILNYFEMNKIEFKNKEKVRLTAKEKKFFKWMISGAKKKDKSKYKDAEEYINDNIGTNKFSYHQINIFIKLFMNQYKSDNTKLKFKDRNRKDVTEECIKKFAECTRYFTLGTYAKELTKNLGEEKDDILQKKTNKIKNNLTKKKDIETSNYDSNINLGLDFDYPTDSENNNNKNKTQNENKSINQVNKINESKGEENKDKISKNYEDLRKNYIDRLSKLFDSDLINEKYEIPLIFIPKNED